MREFLYVYGTGNRDDGMRYAVAECLEWVSSNGPDVALFRDAADAHRFAYAEQARTGVMVHILPSAEWDGE